MSEGTLSRRPGGSGSSLGSVQLWLHITLHSDQTLGESFLSLGPGSRRCGVTGTKKMTSVSSTLKLYFVIGEPNETLNSAAPVGMLRLRCCTNIGGAGWEGRQAPTNLPSFTFLLLHPPSEALRRL